MGRLLTLRSEVAFYDCSLTNIRANFHVKCFMKFVILKKKSESKSEVEFIIGRELSKAVYCPFSIEI